MRIDFSKLLNKLIAFINRLEMAFHGFRDCQMAYVVGINKWERDSLTVNTSPNLIYRTCLEFSMWINRSSSGSRVPYDI